MPKVTSALANLVKELVLKTRTGDQEAREQLAKTIFPPIKKVVYKYKKNYQDCVSTSDYIVAKVIKKLDYLDVNKNILSYIKLLASNHCIDEYRSTAKKNQLVTFTDNEALDQHPANLIYKNQLTQVDFLDLYEYVTNCKVCSKIIFSLEKEKLTPEETSKLYNKDVPTILLIQKRFHKRFNSLCRKKLSFAVS